MHQVVRPSGVPHVLVSTARPPDLRSGAQALGIQPRSMRLTVRLIVLGCPVIVLPHARATAQRGALHDSTQAISAWVANIEHSRSGLSTIALDLPSSSNEGSQVALFHRGDVLRKVTVVYYGESGKATDCYYVLNNEPRFLVRTEFRYTRPMSGKLRSQTTERVWLNADTVFLWKDERGRTDHTAADLKERGEEVRRDFANLLATIHESYRSRDRMPNVHCS